MDFDVDEEQTLLKANVDRLAEAVGRFAATGTGRRSLQADREAWRRFGELGFLALPFAAEDGGVGAGPVELMLVAEALGRNLCLLPYVAGIGLAGALLRHGASEEQRRSLLPPLMEGSRIAAFAGQEPSSRYDLADVQTTARQSGSEWIINGHKSGVISGDAADFFIVSARLEGDRFDRSGIGLFVVEATAAGVLRRAYVAQDDTRGAELVLSEVRVPSTARLNASSVGFSVIERAVDCAVAASISECVGLRIMEAMLNITVDYLKTRRQFGKAISEFQALQHRAADMLVALELARGMAFCATAMTEHEDARQRRLAIVAAKVQVGESLRFVAGNAVQLHGGIGVTEECAIGPYFKRATILEMFLGDTDHYLAQLSEMDELIELTQADQ